ncbi:unnamed protein product [Allacma fusca]|uniref:Tyrosinase copper-binding domain-containing protein n=2 Tax=Allacma fusca TaxID=39272 RepID=A0A8J2JTS4_9HEXA|nr:unnamed protein product [Allacma fusca]
MGDTATAMRDPAFYRWHKYVDDIFARYKASLQPYTQQQLLWEGTQVTGVSVQTPNNPANILSTHWTQSDIDLSRGMDFGRSAETGGAVWARSTHLNHERFTYQISVTSNAAEQVRGTVRIFLAPRNNQRGERLSFRDQRQLFFELDRFSTNLQPGNNTITRNSQDSTLTIPWNETFRDLENLPQDARNITGAQAVCGCGWPDHMLLPRGSATGCVFDLFVMVTNGAEDAVARNATQSEAQRQGCKDAFVYCGILDELYPDRKAMGFPFDRNATVPNTSTPIATLEQFIPANSNMFTTQVTIRHSDRITLRGNGAPPGMGRIDAEGNVITAPAPSPSNSTGRPGRGPGGQAPGQGGQRPGPGQGGQRPGQGGQRPGRPARPQQGSNQPIVFGDESPPPARRGSRRQRDFDETGRISPEYFDE